MNNKVKKGLRARDIATIGIFSALLFAITVVVGAVTGMVPLLVAYSVAFVALLSGPLYMLIMAKVHKPGAVIMTSLLVGVIWALMGGITVFACLAITGIIGELICCKTKYKSKIALSFSFILYAIGYYLGAVGPIYYWTSWFRSHGYSEEYADAVIGASNTFAAYLSIPITLLAAVASCWLAHRMLKKHFEKAGIVGGRID